MTSKASAGDPLANHRRRWLLRSGASLAGALSVGSLGNLVLHTQRAHAADYKALVCVFLYGGNDGTNTIVPTDAARYAQYAEVRSGLALPHARLRPLPGISYGLHPALSALAPAWSAGQLVPLFNVGPLNRLMSKAQFKAEPSTSPLLPDNLFSHSDQQILWETASTDALTRAGWGGRASALLRTANPVISVSGSPRFGQSELESSLTLPGDPGSTFGAYGLQPSDMGWEPRKLRKVAVDALYSQRNSLQLADAFGAAQRNAFVVSERLTELVKIAPKSAQANTTIDAAFAPLITTDNRVSTHLGRQLYQVAKLIHGNATVRGNRQIFFTEMNGFDSHAHQAITGNPTEGDHARLLKELGDALACFNTAMKNLGLGNAVTAFTQSDFGRTLLPNTSNGTDHGWGNHHLVLGGAVKGGRSYGTYPELTLGGPNDVGVETWERQGRWLPTTSVDQYVATLLRWFGADGTQLGQILPNLANFSSPHLGFV